MRKEILITWSRSSSGLSSGKMYLIIASDENIRFPSSSSRNGKCGNLYLPNSVGKRGTNVNRLISCLEIKFNEEQDLQTIFRANGWLDCFHLILMRLCPINSNNWPFINEKWRYIVTISKPKHRSLGQMKFYAKNAPAHTFRSEFLKFDIRTRSLNTNFHFQSVWISFIAINYHVGLQLDSFLWKCCQKCKIAFNLSMNSR